MTEKELCEYINRIADQKVKLQVQQRFLDELNEHGRIMSREEFLQEAKKVLE